MPKSKRDKKVSLTKTNKKGLLLKQKTIEDVRNSVNRFEHIFLFTIDNMRNTKLKDLRNEWKDSRFFFGKNKVMSIALGKTKCDELDDQLNLLSRRIKGQCGLLMTNRDVPAVVKFFQEYSEPDYAKAGFIANKNIDLPQGPLGDFSHTIEPHLRRLGLPTTLEKGVVHLVKDYQVCKEGNALTPEQASILKLLGIQIANFKVSITCRWSKGKGFHKDDDISEAEVEDSDDDDDHTLEDDAMDEDDAESR